MHQLAVRVDGWKEVTPVSVDKVGVYFRQAQPQDTAASIVSLNFVPFYIIIRYLCYLFY